MANVNGGGNRTEFQSSEAEMVTVGKTLDANKYATKKTIAQGMLDIALLTANASQLKYVLQLGQRHEFYYIMVSLIASSIVLQVTVGILFLVIGTVDINRDDNHRSAVILNDLVLIFIFVISVINIIISSFGIQHIDMAIIPSNSNLTTAKFLGK